MNRPFRRVDAAALAVAALALVWCIAAMAGAVAQRPLKNPILLQAWTDRETYWLGEPVLVHCRVVNWVPSTVAIDLAPGLQASTDLRIVKNGRPSDRYRAHFDIAPITPTTIELPYGKGYEWDVTVLYDPESPERPVLPEAGEYLFRIRQEVPYRPTQTVSIPPGTAFPVSQVGPIRVVAPPEAHRGALKILLSDWHCLRDLNRQLASVESRPLFQRVVRDFPKSRYAPWCLHALGNLNRIQGPNRPGAYDEALEQFGQLAEDYPDYPLHDEARMQYARILYLLGRLDEAYAVVEQVIAESESNMMRFRSHPLVGPLAGQPDNPYADANTQSWELFPITDLVQPWTLRH